MRIRILAVRPGDPYPESGIEVDLPADAAHQAVAEGRAEYIREPQREDTADHRRREVTAQRRRR